AALPAPRFASGWAALVYALATLTLAYPALVGRFLVNPHSDQYIAGYAFREFGATMLRTTGNFPLWNPYLFGGMPYVAAMHGDIFYPTFLLRLIMPVDVAMTWGMIGHFFLCGLATYWFLRRACRFSFFPALIGGAAYMMGGFVSSLPSAGHDGKLFVSALFPVALLVLTWCVRDGRKWAWGVFSIIVGLAVLTPHPQLLQYLLLTCGAWGVFLAFGGVGADKLPQGTAIRRLALALGAVIMGGAIGAIQYVPVREYVNWSPRAPGFDYQVATSFSFPIEELINTYLPQFSGILDNYWGRNGIHFHSEYVGATVLLLAFAAFGAGWSGARKRLLWFWVGTGIVTLLWALGGSTPFFEVIYAIVPGTKFFRAPSTIFFVTTFAIAVLAALGTERLLAGKFSVRYVYGWAIGATVVTVFALAGGFTVLAQNIAVSPELAGKIDINAPDVKVGALRSLLFVGLTCGGVLLLMRGKLAPRVAGWALVALVVVDLWSVERLYWEFSEPAKTLYASDTAIEFLKKIDQPFRVVGLGASAFPMAVNDPNLNADGLMVHGIRVAYGYHGNELGRYQYFEDQYLNPTVWALLNSEFLLINTDTIPVPGARRVVGPIKDAAGSTVSLFQLPGEHPFAWVTPVMIKYPDAAVEQAFRANNFPVHSVAIFDTSSKITAANVSTIPGPLRMTTHVDSYAPGHIALTLSAPAPEGSALVVSENYYPGWHATVDGKPAAAERADLTLIGVPLPAGATKVELNFSSDTYKKGKEITLAAIALAVLASLGGLFGPRPKEQSA
ncbi:MAG TPA: YfhO family protein, partial [Gemmatimonadaceae bacterium]|nr:YfhO family protein [Gemmatimonadaceae bacterium]